MRNRHKFESCEHTSTNSDGGARSSCVPPTTAAKEAHELEASAPSIGWDERIGAPAVHAHRNVNPTTPIALDHRQPPRLAMVIQVQRTPLDPESGSDERCRRNLAVARVGEAL